MYEDQPLAAGGNRGPRHLRYAHIGGRPHDSDDGLGALSDAETHEWTAIVGGNVVGQHLGHCVPVAGRVDRPEPLEGSTCRVFQPWRTAIALVEPRERCVEGRLVEHFIADHHVAVDRLKSDPLHSASNPS